MGTPALRELHDPLVSELGALLGCMLANTPEIVADVLGLPEAVGEVREGDHGTEPAPSPGLANRSSCVGPGNDDPTHAPDTSPFVEIAERFPGTEVTRSVLDLLHFLSVNLLPI